MKQEKPKAAKTIAIIPARGGSKGIPKKNIIDFCGRPLIYWTIAQALKTKEIDSVFVTSDCDEILNMALSFGTEVIRRPSEIAGDEVDSEPALLHALQVIGFQPEIVVMLQATSPLRKPEDLSLAIKQFRRLKLDSSFSAALLEDFLIWEKNAAGEMNSFNYDYKHRGRRQDRKPQYVENGSFYLFKPEIIAQGNRLGGKIGIFLMDMWQSFEIDAREDVELVKLLFEQKLKGLYIGGR